jgi:hypothetical protein
MSSMLKNVTGVQVEFIVSALRKSARQTKRQKYKCYLALNYDQVVHNLCRHADSELKLLPH